MQVHMARVQEKSRKDTRSGVGSCDMCWSKHPQQISKSSMEVLLILGKASGLDPCRPRRYALSNITFCQTYLGHQARGPWHFWMASSPSPTFHTYAGERIEGMRAKQEDLPALIFKQLDLQASNKAATLKYPSIKEPLAALPVHKGCV